MSSVTFALELCYQFCCGKMEKTHIVKLLVFHIAFEDFTQGLVYAVVSAAQQKEAGVSLRVGWVFAITQAGLFCFAHMLELFQKPVSDLCQGMGVESRDSMQTRAREEQQSQGEARLPSRPSRARIASELSRVQEPYGSYRAGANIPLPVAQAPQPLPQPARLTKASSRLPVVGTASAAHADGLRVYQAAHALMERTKGEGGPSRAM